MAGELYINTGIVNNSNIKDTVLDTALVYAFNQEEKSFSNADDMRAKLGFTTVNANNPNTERTSTGGTIPMDKIQDGQSLPIITLEKGADKGYEIIPYGGKMKVDKLAYDFLAKSATFDGADSSVLRMYSKFQNGLRTLMRNANKADRQEQTRLFTAGTAVTSTFGPGSATPRGQALFANNHQFTDVNGVTGTFTNVLGTVGTSPANAALTATSLQDAIDTLKSSPKMDGGSLVELGGVFRLGVSRQGAVAARQIINTAGSMAGQYSGRNNNSEELNQFNFNGNLVEICEVPELGQASKEGGLGTADYWFIMDTEYIIDSEALVYYTLNNGEADMWEDKDTKGQYASFYKSFAYDHYEAHRGALLSEGSA